MKLTVGYVRVSTTEQSLSVEAQTARLKAYAKATDRNLDHIYVDYGVSGKSLNRPELAELLNGVRDSLIGTVIVIKLDRLTRSVRDLGDLVQTFQEYQANLISVSESLDTGSASGRMVMNMMATVAQWEREVIVERTTAVMRHKRENGRVYGKVPMGYMRVGDALRENPAEQKILREMRTRRAAGESAHSIARWLNEEGVPARQGGKKWYPASVLRVLTSQMATAAV